MDKDIQFRRAFIGFLCLEWEELFFQYPGNHCEINLLIKGFVTKIRQRKSFEHQLADRKVKALGRKK